MQRKKVSIVKDTVFAALKSLNKTNVPCSLGLWKNKGLNCCTNEWLNIWFEGNNNLEKMNCEHVLNMPSSLSIIELATKTN